MTPRAASSAATWDANAGRYARQTRHELRAVWRAAALADAGPEDRVLDVATGTGLMLDVLRVRPRPPRHVLAVDRSPGMLAQLPQLPPGWTAREADATALPAEDGTFDVVTVSHLLQLLDEQERRGALREVHRVLAPGGRVVTITPHVPRRGAGRLGAALLDTAATRSPARLGGLRTCDPRADLDAAGLPVQRAAQLRRGYPSLVVLARRRPR